LGHRVCQFHVRRWVGRALKKLEEEIPPEWMYVIWEIRGLIDELPSNGDKLLYDIWKEMPGRTTKPNEERTPLEKLRDIVLRLNQDWDSYIAFYDDPGIPWTNNRTEQIIGRLKNRAKRVRGYKSSEGLLAGSLVPVNFGLEIKVNLGRSLSIDHPLNFTHQVCYGDDRNWIDLVRLKH